MSPMIFEIKPMAQEKRKSSYEPLMRKFNESRKELCRYSKTDNLNIWAVERSEKKFCTGSTYEGEWNILGMDGYGDYKTSTGTFYMGSINDGEFHGRGELFFTSGDSVRGTWEKGQFKSGEYFFNNELVFESENWGYCCMPDRRFATELEGSIQPVDQSYKTAEQPTRTIPDGFYDTGDGLYDPLTKVVYNYDDLSEIMRTPKEEERTWIVNNCRRGPDGSVGPQPELYEAFYQPTKYLDEESSESEGSSFDCDFLARVGSMKARKSSRFMNLSERRFMAQSLSSNASRRNTADNLKTRPSIYEQRPKFFI